jgi:hypothetical protein
LGKKKAILSRRIAKRVWLGVVVRLFSLQPMCHFCKYQILRNYQKRNLPQVTEKVRNFFALCLSQSACANFFRDPLAETTTRSIHFGGERVFAYAQPRSMGLKILRLVFSAGFQLSLRRYKPEAISTTWSRRLLRHSTPCNGKVRNSDLISMCLKPEV